MILFSSNLHCICIYLWETIIMMTMCLCWINIYMNNLQMDDVSGPSWSPDNSRYSYFNVKSSGYTHRVLQGHSIIREFDPTPFKFLFKKKSKQKLGGSFFLVAIFLWKGDLSSQKYLQILSRPKKKLHSKGEPYRSSGFF